MLTVFQTQSFQPSKVNSGVCAQGKIVKTPFKRGVRGEFFSGSLDSGKLRTNFFHTWSKCCGTFTGTQFRDKLLYLTCNKVFLGKNKRSNSPEEDGWVKIEEEPGIQSEVASESRTGLRKRVAGKLKYGAFILSSKIPHSLKRRKVQGDSRIVFDSAYDLKWSLGYLPNVYPNSASTDKEANTSFGYFRRRAVTYSKRAPYPTEQMWCMENSSPVCQQSGMGGLYPKSTPIDVCAILEKYQGLEEIYITEEAHFFINNLASDSGKTDRKLTDIMSSFVKQTGAFRTCSAHSLDPPSIISRDIVLRPLLLVKNSKLCLQIPSTGDVVQGNGECDQPNFFELIPGTSAQLSSQALFPSMQGVLKELKLVRKLGEHQNSYTVPVWQNLLNTKQSQAKGNSSSCLTKKHAITIPE